MSIADVLTRLDDIEKSFNSKLEEINKKFDDVSAKVINLETRMDTVEKTVQSLENMKSKMQSEIKKTKSAGIMAEYKSKELNVILSNVPQESLQEDMKESFNKVKAVIKDVLLVDDIEITHAHRLPKGGSATSRPLIFKVKSMLEKDKLWQNIKNVVKYNDGKSVNDKRYVEMQHLPKKLFVDKMTLKADFKQAKIDGKNPIWKLDKQNVEFCYKVGAIWYRPKARNDD